MKSPITFISAFDQYETTSVIGEGGAGRVYAVSNLKGDCFAIKMLKPENLEKQRLKRFQNEINFCQTCSHPNIVQVVDYGTANVQGVLVPFFVMPLMERTLRDEIPFENGPNALKVFGQILDGVEAAHLNEVWHRDLKPENILLAEEAVIADFGIAHFSEPLLHTAIQTKDNDRLANFAYAAPEQREFKAADQRSDLFSLGLILNELFTGSVPHGTSYKTIGNMSEEFKYLDSIVLKLLSQNPTERFQTVSDVKREISSLGTQYLAEQKLIESEKRVVPVHTPDSLPTLKIVNVNIVGKRLEIELNESPPTDWIGVFSQGHYGFRAIHGHGPQDFQIIGCMAVTSNIQFNQTQQIIDCFKSWLPLVTDITAGKRKQKAEQEKREAQDRIQKEIRERKARLEALKNLKF